MRPFYKDCELFEEGTVFALNGPYGVRDVRPDTQHMYYEFTIEKPYPLFEQLTIYFDYHIRKNMKYNIKLNYTGKYILPSIESGSAHRYYFNMGDYLVQLIYNGETYRLISDSMENLFAFTDKVKNYEVAKEGDLIQI